MNSIVIAGMIESTPELRYTSDGQYPIASFNLKFIQVIKEQLVSNIIPVKAWGNLAQSIQESYQANQFVIVKGRIQINKVDREGYKESLAELIADKVSGTSSMIPDFCVINLVGRTGKDTETRYFESGSVLSQVSLAVDRTKKGESDWFDLKAWGKTAETMANYVRKGSLIGVTGSLEIESWTDRQSGNLRTKPVIKVDNLRLLGSKRDNENQYGLEEEDFAASTPKTQTRQPVAAAAKQEKQPEPAQEWDDSEIPF